MALSECNSRDIIEGILFLYQVQLQVVGSGTNASALSVIGNILGKKNRIHIPWPERFKLFKYAVKFRCDIGEV